jgi:hypothetical protein
MVGENLGKGYVFIFVLIGSKCRSYNLHTSSISIGFLSSSLSFLGIFERHGETMEFKRGVPHLLLVVEERY